MSRRLNFTKRQRIKRDEVDIHIVPGAYRLTVDVSMDLKRIIEGGLQASLPVFLEAYHGPRNQRHKLGVAGSIDKTRIVLDEFGGGEPVLFRIKVVDDAKVRGRIAAACDNIKPRNPDDGPAESLLAIKTGHLDGEIYRVVLPSSGDEEPVLVLNEALDEFMPGGIKTYARSPLFVSLVFPAVIRQILTWYVLIDADDDDDDDDGPRQRWMSFAQRLTGTEPPEGDDDRAAVIAWIDAVVAAFGEHLNAIERFKSKAEA